jgi:D-aminopeptidase
MSVKDKPMLVPVTLGLALIVLGAVVLASEDRPRAREFGLVVGVLPPGPLNAITDVAGVMVGHVTLIEGKDVRTGITAVLPHGGNVFQDKVPAGISVANGYGKLTGVTQVMELGTLETPIVLTNTLSVPTAADAVIDDACPPGNERVGRSIPLPRDERRWSAISAAVTHLAHVLAAIRPPPGPVAEGAVGPARDDLVSPQGGSARPRAVCPENRGSYTVGVLVQTNFGVLTIRGVPFDKRAASGETGPEANPAGDGSCMIVVATDAPLDARNLERLAKRALIGIARTGGYFSNGSGDYAIAFSTASSVRVPNRAASPTRTVTLLRDDAISPLFQAAAEASEEAIWNSLFKAVRTEGKDGHVAEALPLDRVKEALR